ncbi:MAG TPA: hypothetical protein VFN91_10300, partial [Myxococcaceae bacterium]|nr:hypothetical protein [Myxococcaceae bacterium]
MTRTAAVGKKRAAMFHSAFLRVATLGLTGLALLSANPASAESLDTYRRWIVEMREAERGPFSAIRWFCKDGRILGPRDHACSDKGEGWQHGEWSDRTKRLRSEGYRVATLLAGIDASKVVAAPDFPESYGQLLIER